MSRRWAGAGVELLREEREDALAQLPGNASEGEGRGIALVLEIGIGSGAEAARGLLTGDAQGLLPDVIAPPPSPLGDKRTGVKMIAKMLRTSQQSPFRSQRRT